MKIFLFVYIIYLYIYLYRLFRKYVSVYRLGVCLPRVFLFFSTFSLTFFDISYERKVISNPFCLFIFGFIPIIRFLIKRVPLDLRFDLNFFIKFIFCSTIFENFKKYF